MQFIKSREGTVIQDPPLARFLFSDIRTAPIWLIIRVLVGWSWLEAGLHKIGEPAWMQTGDAIRGYWERAVAIPEAGRPPISYDWYRAFIQNLLDSNAQSWFGPLVAIGEVLVGIALIIGAFVGVAAVFGVFMNWNFIMAGSASTNGLLGVAGLLLILAWKVAGYYGADRWLLKWLGTPWHNAQPEAPPRNQAASTS
jgi:thiosulfate dehydrogenase [quinone] large subunit